MSDYDVAIIGAGIAGASLAAALPPELRVIILEMEDQPGYHTTGRSNAFWQATYGGPGVEPLTSASLGDLSRPDEGESYLRPRGAITLGREDDRAEIEGFAAAFAGSQVRLEAQTRAQLVQRIPGLREDWICGLFEAACFDIDVARLHADYLGKARRNGAEIRLSAPLEIATRRDGMWRVMTSKGEIRACRLVNAAGAWADVVAVRAGAPARGIQPYRRTIAQVDVGGRAPASLPLVIDVSGRFYFKPENGRIWLSPHDETASVPCDAAPDELDVAHAIDRFQHVVDWPVVRVEHRWAGLRSFAPDRLPVYGEDPDAPGFYWCAGQGGFGIQTAPAAAAMCAALISGATPQSPADVVDPAPYAPGRLRPVAI